MGRCWYYTGDGRQQCVSVSSKAACDGTYEDGDCPSWCFFVTELTSHVIAKSGGDHVVEVAAQAGVLVAFDFRDVILRHSTLGREVVDLYTAHAKQAVEAMRKHPQLLLRALRLVTTGILLAQDMLRVHSLKGHGVAGKALKLDQKTVREALEVAGELGKLSPTKEFDHVVSRIEAIFKKIEGMTTAQILDFLALERR